MNKDIQRRRHQEHSGALSSSCTCLGPESVRSEERKNKEFIGGKAHLIEELLCIAIVVLAHKMCLLELPTHFGSL